MRSEPRLGAHVTLALCTVLHAFTHAFQVMLIPLYVMVRDDLGFRDVSRPTLLVTVYSLVYCLGSYPSGVLADRADRKRLLGIGLIGNAAAVLCMGLTRQYEVLVALAVAAGLCGTLFHPSANALAPAHYPRSPGMAIGVLGMGAGLGFFAGPQFAGWRAEAGGWSFAGMGDWQRPCIELGLAGLCAGALFLLFAREARVAPLMSGAAHPPLGRDLRWKVVRIAMVLACRDFAGYTSMSLASIYLLRAQGLDARRTGFILGSMMLVSVVVNPLAVYLSAGRRRLATLAGVLVAGGAIIATVPAWPVGYVLPVLCAFQACHLGSYAVSDAALLERVPAAVRGRVVGLFLTIAGTIAATGPLAVGAWSDRLRARAADPTAYWPAFATLAILMTIASASAFLIARLGPPNQANTEDLLSELPPASLETAL